MFLMCVSLMGCVSMDVVEQTTPNMSATQKNDLTNIDLVFRGMSHQEITSLMGTSVKIGYAKHDNVEGTYKAITIVNPHKTEEIKVKNKFYKVVYYFTDVKSPDGMISDEELTPLVFDEEKLVAKGWLELNNLKNK